MPSRQRDYQRELEGILDGLAESIEAGPPEEILSDAQAGGENAEAIADSVRETLLNAVKIFEQKKLDAARQAYRVRAMSGASKRFPLPDTTHQRRQLLFSVFQNVPRLEEALTIQHRRFEDLSDEDIQSTLEDLAELGFLDDWAEAPRQE